VQYIKIAVWFLLLLAAGWFIQVTDWPKVIDALRLIKFNFIWVLVVTFLASLCGTLGWRYCMGTQGNRVPLWDLFLIRHIGETAGLINPTGMIGGEALKVLMLQDRAIDRTTVLTSVLVSRVLTIATQLILFIFVALILYYDCIWRWLIQMSWLCILKACLLLVMMALFVQYYRKIAAFINSKIAKNRSNPSRTLLKGINNIASMRMQFGTAIKGQQSALLKASVLLTLHWIWGGVEFYLILLFLKTNTTMMQGIFVDMGVVFFKVAGSFVPGQVGIEEYGNKILLNIIGIREPTLWVTASILRRSRQLFWLVFGILTYFAYYKIRRIAQPVK